mgnify:CR=1 FL=1
MTVPITKKMQPIKILMLGGYMCGKTSLIASVFGQMQNGALNKIFSVADVSPITGIEESKYPLIDKRCELIYFIENQRVVSGGIVKK